tara:strand:- start:821 stop:1366 length:546 start_codon:yes stop_codon:yes gene_type:complete
MKPLAFFTLLIFILTLSCKSSKSKASDAQIKTLEILVENKNYTIESDWARPQVTNAMQQIVNSGLLPAGSSVNAINLIGNSNFLTISGDSITSYLPYFGERQMNVGYGGTDSAIQLQGLLEDYEVVKGKNNRYTISFSARGKSENFRIKIVLFPNLKSDMQLTANGRFPISYTGHVESLEK